MLYNISGPTSLLCRRFATNMPNGGHVRDVSSWVGASSGNHSRQPQGKMMARNFTNGLAEFGGDMLWHATRLAQGSIDLVTLALVGMLVYLTTINAAEAGLHSRPMLGVRASVQGAAGIALASSHAPTSCGLTNDLLISAHRSCIDVLVLEPAAI